MFRKPSLNFIHVAICASFLSACAVGPDYERPEVNPPEKFRSESSQPSEGVALGTVLSMKKTR